MNKMELDSFTAEAGMICKVGGDDKWRKAKAESLITQKVRQVSRSSFRTGKCAVKTASFSTMTEDLADVNVNCKEVR